MSALTDGYFLQPLMTLLFADLTQDFINFSTLIQGIDPNNPQSPAEVDSATKHFRQDAAQDAFHLTLIGA
jgi:ATP-binding cassette subfamily B (MDR/TAP) protein 1